MQKEANGFVKHAILSIARGYEGIKIEESNFPDNDCQRLFLSYSRGTPAGNYLIINPLKDRVDIIAYYSGTERARIGLMQLDNGKIKGSALFSKQLGKLLEKLNMTVDFKPVPPLVEESIAYVSDFKGLDGILFALYGGLPICVLGTHCENLEAFSHFLNLLPNSISNNISLHSFCQDFLEGINWMGFAPTKRSLEIISEHVDKALIVSVASKRASSPYSCSLVEELATRIQEGEIATCEKLESHIQKFFEVVGNLDPQDEVEEIASRFDTTIDNAEFFLQIRRSLGPVDSFSEIKICKKRS